MAGPSSRELSILDLRRRERELEQALLAYEEAKPLLMETEERLRSLLAITNEAVAFSDNGIVTEVNPQFADMFGYTVAELPGMQASAFHPPEARALIEHMIQKEFSAPYEALCLRKDGSTFTAEICGKATSYDGRPGRVTVFQDITEQKREEEIARAALVHEKVIRAQEAILAELSTPLLPISDEIIVLPLIGAVSAERAARVAEALVEGVARQKARTAILDITGVPDVDAPVAEALLRAARATHLLGAEVVLTGIRPEVAMRLVQISEGLSTIVTYGTLQRGVAYALNKWDRAGARGFKRRSP